MRLKPYRFNEFRIIPKVAKAEMEKSEDAGAKFRIMVV
jgi:hypothetical protein